jgi:HD-GYP domain-containing protein (c-di-GMP phosphodiesterase class II)
MKMHAAHTETILSRIAAFGDLAAIAGAHHERLDGKGYPHGLKGEQIAFESRIITVADIFDALTAERPYRAAMPVSKALAIMTEMVDTAIDADCFDALQRALAMADLGAADREQAGQGVAA